LLGLGRAQNGVDLTDPASPVRLCAGEPVSRSLVRTGPRVGVAAAATRPWRFWVDGSPEVSATAGGGSPAAKPVAACGMIGAVSEHILDELAWRG